MLKQYYIWLYYNMLIYIFTIYFEEWMTSEEVKQLKTNKIEIIQSLIFLESKKKKKIKIKY